MDQTIPAHGPAIMTQHHRNIFPVVPNGNQEFYRSILKAQPKLLGVVQVVLVSLQLSLGAILTTSLQYYDYTTANSGINYWGSLFYLSSGAVSMLAEVKPSHLLVKVFLVSNVFSCLTSFIEFCLICKDIDRSDYCYECFIVIRVNHISLAFLFIATVVQFSISAFLAVVSWRSLKHSNDFASEVCVVNNEYRYVMSPEASQATYNHQN